MGLAYSLILTSYNISSIPWLHFSIIPANVRNQDDLLVENLPTVVTQSSIKMIPRDIYLGISWSKMINI